MQPGKYTTIVGADYRSGRLGPDSCSLGCVMPQDVTTDLSTTPINRATSGGGWFVSVVEAIGPATCSRGVNARCLTDEWPNPYLLGTVSDLTDELVEIGGNW